MEWGVTLRTSQGLGKLRPARFAPPPAPAPPRPAPCSRPAPPLDYKSRRAPHSRTLRQGKMADAAATAGAAGSGTVRAGGRRGAGAEKVGAFPTFPLSGLRAHTQKPSCTRNPAWRRVFQAVRDCHPPPPPPPFSRLGGGLRSRWTCVLIGLFFVGGGGWEPGTAPDWSTEAVFTFLLAR